MTRLKLLLWFTPVVAFAAIIAVWGSDILSPGQDETQQQSVTDAMRDFVSGEFSLIDHTGRAVTDKDFNGAWLLVFFGYTHCPDICPTTLGTIALVLDALGEDAAKLRPLFVTVDPARDTPEVLAEYVAAFHPRIVGLTGTAEQISAAAKSHGVYLARSTPGEDHDHYAMEHTVRLYLMDPKGVYAAYFSSMDTVEAIVEGIAINMSR